MRAMLLASAAIAFISDICETVLIKGADGNPMRVNKADYDADQGEGGAKKMHLHTDDKKPQPDPVVGEGAPVPVHPELTIPPAPSAPKFVNPVAPSTANADTLMVAKGGTGKNAKFFVVRPDGSRVEDMRDIDKDGYTTEQLAWAAILAAKKQPYEQHGEATPPHNIPPAPPIA